MLNTASIQADSGCGLTVGIIGLMNKGQPRKMDDWGSLRALAWGADRAMDYFETDKAVDAKRVGVEGHSRWGKATLVTMAYDERFAIGYVSSSGEGGAKLHRRKFGELIENLNGTNEYHWMAGNFMKYGGRWDTLPVDSHELIAMVAPRPLFLSAGSGPLTNPDGTYQLMTADDPRCQANRGPCATQPVNIMDAWVDAKGTFMAGVGADPVYRLLGKKGTGHDGVPEDRDRLDGRRPHVPAARRWAHGRRRTGRCSSSSPTGSSSLIRGALPLGLPDTRPRLPLRRLAPVAWLARCARSHCYPLAVYEIASSRELSDIDLATS